MLRCLAGLVVAALALSLLAGCGGSSHKSTSSAPAGARPTAARLDYQSRTVAALSPVTQADLALGRGNVTDLAAWDRLIGAEQSARAKVQALGPPSDVAQLHHQLLSLLSRATTDAAKSRAAIGKRDVPALRAAIAGYSSDGQRFTVLSRQFGSRGYTKVAAALG